MEISPSAQASAWQFWIDVGGTFTDCIARDPHGRLHRHKTLSSGVIKGSVGAGSDRQCIRDPARQNDPNHFWNGWSLRLIDSDGNVLAKQTVSKFDVDDGSIRLSQPLDVSPEPNQTYELASDLEAPLVAVRYVLRLPLVQPLPEIMMRLGTTRGTNALLTRSGGKTALVTTAGFKDILRIGYQARPKLFDLNIRKPSPLYSSVAEINERIGCDGAILEHVDQDQIRGGVAATQGRWNRIGRDLPAQRVRQRRTRATGRSSRHTVGVQGRQRITPSFAPDKARFARRTQRSLMRT